MDVVEPAYLKRRGLSSHRVARATNSPRVLSNLSRWPSGQLTSGAVGKVMTNLKGELPETPAHPWVNCRTVPVTLSLAKTKAVPRNQGHVDAGRLLFMGPSYVSLSIGQLTTFQLFKQAGRASDFSKGSGHVLIPHRMESGSAGIIFL